MKFQPADHCECGLDTCLAIYPHPGTLSEQCWLSMHHAADHLQMSSGWVYSLDAQKPAGWTAIALNLYFMK